ncbi:polyprotein [Elysia marginata]|uniref:Polyprotein n=1 Tax=Elysia marginata TaxID=1093978 RepID=A0AAV4FWV2_9GAST|nr:polyprotein [Elysia marginata]
MISSGIIEPSSSPYASPITVVKKKDSTIRLCIDFRRLNSITEFDAEPIPTLEELLTKMQGARFISKLDLTKGYWQIPIREDCRHLTAFQTPRGLYQFVFMPFGLSTASSTFQRMMQRVLGKADFIASYFDDVMIFSKTWDDHVVHIRKTLELLENAGLTAKPAKACMGFTQDAIMDKSILRRFGLRFRTDCEAWGCPFKAHPKTGVGLIRASGMEW